LQLDDKSCRQTLFANAAPSPLLFTTPKDSGVHVISFSPPAGFIITVAYLSAPASNSYSLDATALALAFDASKASTGESGIAGVGESTCL